MTSFFRQNFKCRPDLGPTMCTIGDITIYHNIVGNGSCQLNSSEIDHNIASTPFFESVGIFNFILSAKTMANNTKRALIMADG